MMTGDAERPRDPVLDALVVHTTNAEQAIGDYRTARRVFRDRSIMLLLVVAAILAVWLVPGTGAGSMVWAGLWIAFLAIGALAVFRFLRLRRVRNELRPALADLVAVRRAARRAAERGEVPDEDRGRLNAVLQEADGSLSTQSVFSEEELEHDAG